MSRKQQSEDSGGLSDRRENGARQETVSDRELISRGHMSREVHDREHLIRGNMRAGNEFPSNEFKSYKSSSVQHSVNGVLPNSIELESGMDSKKSECKKDDMNVEVSLKCEVFPPTPPTRTSSKAKKIGLSVSPFSHASQPFCYTLCAIHCVLYIVCFTLCVSFLLFTISYSLSRLNSFYQFISSVTTYHLPLFYI